MRTFFFDEHKLYVFERVAHYGGWLDGCWCSAVKIIRSYVNLELSEVVIGCSSSSIKKWEKMLNCVVMMIIIAVDDVGKRNLISGSFFFNETAFHCSTTTTTLTWILCKIISLQINFISSNSFSIFLSTPIFFLLA